MDSFPTEMTLLDQTDLKRSFSKALNCKNGHIQNEIDVCNVLNFIQAHLDDNNPEISYLIECNLAYLQHYLGGFTMYFTNGGENIRSNYNLDDRRRLEASWISNDIELHKFLIPIIEKYKDIAWMKKNKGRHATCVYYALCIMCNLCMGQDKNNINTIIKNTNIIKISLDILNNDKKYKTITFLEQFAAIQLLGLMIPHDDNIIDIFCDIQQTCNINIIKLLISQCCNSFHILLLAQFKKFRKSQTIILAKYKNQIEERNEVFDKKESDDMMTYGRSPAADQNENTKICHMLAYRNRMMCIKNLVCLARQIRNPKRMDVLCNETDVPTIYLKRLLQVSLYYMRQGKISYPPQVNTIDIISILVQNKSIAERLVCDNEILETLIIAARSRSHMCEFAHREIIATLYCIVCEHELLPKKYCKDLIFVLNDIKEINWKNINFYDCMFPHYTLSIMIIKMLKQLFGVKTFEKKNKEKYQCAICQDEMQYPYKVKCDHSFCFGCLDRLIQASKTFYGYFIQKNHNEINNCPLCRTPIVGFLSRNDGLSDFKLNKKLMDEINSELICFEDEETKSNFEGTENQFWEYIEKNHKIEAELKNEFVNFCEFMKRKTEISVKRKELITRANEIKLKGNKFFKAKKYNDAIAIYKEALQICPLDEYKLRSKYYSNIALCCVNMKDYINAFRATQNGLSLIYSPSEDRTFVKLSNNMAISLNQLLKENEMFNKYHHVIKIGECNSLCPNRRLYDILLFQCAWDFNYWHSTYQTNALLDTGKTTGAVEHMKKVKKTDPYILKMKKIEQGIGNYLHLNFDEFQLVECVMRLNAQKQEEKNEKSKLVPLDADIITLPLYKWEL
eukprot:210601_1